MKNIMILGASDLQIPLIKEVVKKGYNPIVVSPNKNEPGFKYATDKIYIDVLEKEKILRYAKYYNIIAIITDQTDIAIRTIGYVNDNLGLKGINYELSCLFTNKYLMREKCESLNIPTIKHKKVKSIEDAMIFFENIEGDAILKPVDSQASKGVYKIENVADLHNYFEESLNFSPSGEVIIEEFINGKEYVVEGLVVNGIFQNLIIGEPFYFNINNVFSASYIRYPPKNQNSVVEKVLMQNKEIIESFGLHNGRTHSEFIYDGNKVYLIETAARGGGAFISSSILPTLTGLNNEELIIDLSVGNESKIELNDVNISCCYLAFYLPKGTIFNINGIEEVTNFDYVIDSNLDTIFIGKNTLDIEDKRNRYIIVLKAYDHDELLRRINIIKTKLKIEVKTDAGIEGIVWN